MIISELYDEIKTYFGELEKCEESCDCFKAGEPHNKITNVGVTMFATPNVIKECIKKNINFLIVHEPVYYNHMDNHMPCKQAERKKEFIEKSGITIARYHDYAHITNNDMIFKGEIKYLDILGKPITCDICAVNRFELEEQMTARELARIIENKLNIKHIKIAGSCDTKGDKLSCCFGTPGHIAEELEVNDFVLTGEICEWEFGELARDYAQMGANKAIIVMGHIGSERAGMMYLTELIHKNHPEFKTEYIECGEVYSYTDD